MVECLLTFVYSQSCLYSKFITNKTSESNSSVSSHNMELDQLQIKQLLLFSKDLKKYFDSCQGEVDANVVKVL